MVAVFLPELLLEMGVDQIRLAGIVVHLTNRIFRDGGIDAAPQQFAHHPLRSQGLELFAEM